MDKFVALSELTCGQRAVISGLLPQAEERRRLRELGFLDGIDVECVLSRRGIGAYLVRGTVIALRDVDSSVVGIKMQAKPQFCEERSGAVCL